MSNMQLFVSIDEYRENVVIEMAMDGKPLGHIILAGEVAEAHARAVLRQRALLRDKLPERELENK